MVTLPFPYRDSNVDLFSLAGLHNRVDTLHHEINTREKVGEYYFY